MFKFLHLLTNKVIVQIANKLVELLSLPVKLIALKNVRLLEAAYGSLFILSLNFASSSRNAKIWMQWAAPGVYLEKRTVQ